MMTNDQVTLRVRKALLTDLKQIMPVFDFARQFMADNGNPFQWGDGYPEPELIQNEIELGHCFVIMNPDEKVIATFCYIVGDDPTYHVIDGGKWLNDAPYAVLHRLASDGSVKGIARFCLDWCFEHTRNLRIDTHADNKVLQHILTNYGFTYCGIIYVRNHSPRLAYQRIVK